MSFFEHHDSHGKKKVVKSSSVQQEVSNTPVTPEVVNSYPFMKVPVVLGETTVQIDLDSIIEFPEPVLEIKKIKKNLKLVQCRLLLPTNKLFLKGFVRKNIQYATPKAGGKDFVSSSIHSLTVDVPFQAVTQIDFLNKPAFKAGPKTTEFEYFMSSPLPHGYASKEKLLSADLSEYNQISGEVFNELPYCELIASHFIEMDEALNRKMGTVFGPEGEICAPFEEGTFTKIEEKMVVELTLKVLQNQQVKMQKHVCKDDEDKDNHHHY
ncbi:CsxC family protein [Robertmurraya sp. P23]|uniref:CsxC family protein n=1 Tax=Robertmurraya sp. P23 TaxID=3436931 RepID=UPI003D95854A